jgi:hypothetical protein
LEKLSSDIPYFNCSFIRDAKKYFDLKITEKDNGNNDNHNNNTTDGNINSNINSNNKKNFDYILSPIVIMMKNDFYDLINEINPSDIFASNCTFSFYKIKNNESCN